jgi:WD40 repeat protein
VDCLAVSPSGAWLASASDNLIRVWDLKAAAAIACLATGDYKVRCLGFSPDGKWLACGDAAQGDDNTCRVRVLDWATDSEVTRMHGHEGPVTGVAFTRDGCGLISSSADGTICMWAIDRHGSPARRLDHDDQVVAVRPAPDGRSLLTSASYHLWLWASDFLSSPARFSVPVEENRTATYSPDAQRFAVGTGGGTITVRESGGNLMALLDSDSPRYCPTHTLAFSLDGRRLAAIDFDKGVRVWDLDGATALECERCPEPGGGWPEQYLPDGRFAIDHTNWRSQRVEEAIGAADVQILYVNGKPWTVTGWSSPGCWATVHAAETELRQKRAGEAIAWIPERLDPIAASPDGRLWVGAVGRRIQAYRLEVVDGELREMPLPDRLAQFRALINKVAGNPSRPPRLEGHPPAARRGCPRCGYAFPEDLLATLEEHFREANPRGGFFGPTFEQSMMGHVDRSTVAIMHCYCGLEWPIHWPSRLPSGPPGTDSFVNACFTIFTFGPDGMRRTEAVYTPPRRNSKLPSSTSVPHRPIWSFSPVIPGIALESNRTLGPGGKSVPGGEKILRSPDNLPAEYSTSPRRLERSDPSGPSTCRFIGDVAALLGANQPKEALRLLNASGKRDPAAENARGVCLMRLGDADGALRVFSKLVFPATGNRMLAHGPVVYKINFASALLLANRVAECIERLDEMDADQDVAVQRLRSAINQWKRQLTFWQKMQWFCGIQPSKPISRDFPLGEL